MKTFGIIENLGGRAVVADLLDKHGHTVTVDAVRMWSKREQIPGAPLRILIETAEKRRIKVKASDLVPINVPNRKPGCKQKVKA